MTEHEIYQWLLSTGLGEPEARQRAADLYGQMQGAGGGDQWFDAAGNPTRPWTGGQDFGLQYFGYQNPNQFSGSMDAPSSPLWFQNMDPGLQAQFGGMDPNQQAFIGQQMQDGAWNENMLNNLLMMPSGSRTGAFEYYGYSPSETYGGAQAGTGDNRFGGSDPWMPPTGPQSYYQPGQSGAVYATDYSGRTMQQPGGGEGGGGEGGGGEGGANPGNPYWMGGGQGGYGGAGGAGGMGGQGGSGGAGGQGYGGAGGAGGQGYGGAGGQGYGGYGGGGYGGGGYGQGGSAAGGTGYGGSSTGIAGGTFGGQAQGGTSNVNVNTGAQPGNYNITYGQAGPGAYDLLNNYSDFYSSTPGAGTDPGMFPPGYQTTTPQDFDYSQGMAGLQAGMLYIPDNISAVEEPLLNMVLGQAGAQDLLGGQYTDAIGAENPFANVEGSVLSEIEGKLQRQNDQALENLVNKYSATNKLGAPIFREALTEQMQQGLLDPLADARIQFGLEQARSSEDIRRNRLADLAGFNQQTIGNLSGALNQQVQRRADETALQQGVFQNNLNNFYDLIGAQQQNIGWNQGLTDEGLRLFLGSQGASLTPGQAMQGVNQGYSNVINSPQQNPWATGAQALSYFNT